MKILLIEDDPVTLQFLGTQIRKLGHGVLEAADAESAWTRFHSEEPQVVVCDWNLPGSTGLDLCRKIRNAVQHEYPYFILITAQHGPDGLAEAMEAGVDDFLAKPVDMGNLAVRLRVADRILAFHRQIGTLQDLLPICMYCKKIRDDKAFWVNVEAYFKVHAGTDFTHSLCPDCYQSRIQPQLDALRKKPDPAP